MNIQCVILAAGKNTRLDTGKPKSLLTIHGVSLIERHIQLFKKIGCREFCVVTGHHPEPIREAVGALAKKYQVQIDTVHNERYDLENGFSVSAVSPWLERKRSEGFFLTMGDHIFQEGFMESFRNKIEKDIEEELCLAVDIPSENNAHIDIEDVTRVKVDERGAILKIGKNIEEYNRYDTGLFYMKPGVFELLQNCFSAQKYTISDLVTALINQQKATTLDIVGFLWNDVDNFNDLDNTSQLDF